MATKNFQAIVSDIIDNILIVNPSVDVKIGEVVRDIFIDVQALQLETLYSIADAAARAQSILTARAQQLDRLGFNFNIQRLKAQRSASNLVIIVKAGVSAQTVLNVGDQFFSIPDQDGSVQTFINTQLTLLNVGQTQAVIPLVNLNPGSSGNVAAYTITQSAYDFADEVYNPIPAIGGTDLETDANFAIRIPLVVTGRFLNTSRGILNTIQTVSDLNGNPFVVTPDNPLSRGQFTSDVYLQRNANYFGTPIQETAPASSNPYIFRKQPIYELNPINSISVFDTVTQQYQSVPSSIDGGITQVYIVEDDPGDNLGYFVGTVKAKKRLRWLNQPPSSSYLISYNYDHTIVDAQKNYDVNNEITNDLLFKQAPVIPVFVSAAVSAVGGSNLQAIYRNAESNLANLFNSFSIGQKITQKDIEISLLQDQNLADVVLRNFDSTYQVALNVPLTGSGALTFATPNGKNSDITPFGIFYEADVNTPFMFYNISGRLWIGKKDIINSTNFNPVSGFPLNQISKYSGVPDENTVTNVAASWGASVYKFYDSVSQTLILNFSTPPTANANGSTVYFNIVQTEVDTIDNLKYVTLAPSLVSPIEPFGTQTNTSNPQYATVLPTGLDANVARIYRNGVVLSPATLNLGDYTVVNPSPGNPLIPDPSYNGLLILQFNFAPSSTDILQYGLLNPNITTSYSTTLR